LFYVLIVVLALITTVELLRRSGILSLGHGLVFGPDRSVDAVDLAGIEDVPCDSCAAVYSTVNAPITEVPMNQLLGQLSSSSKGIVRVRAILFNDAGQLSLNDKLSRQNSLSAELANRKLAACRGTERVLHKAAGVENWYDGAAQVVVLGRVGLVDDGFSPAHRGFVILCVEDAVPVKGAG
jgi:hypothetical protein